MANRLKEKYDKTLRPELQKELGYKSVMQVPRLLKIVVNSGVGEAVLNGAAINEVAENLGLITGQKPVVTKARRAVSGFKIRENMEIGVAVTLRGERMWNFFDKLISVVFPRTKDFRGISPKSFDGRGNFSLGIREHTVFPEIDSNKVQKLRGLQVTLVFASKSDSDTKLFLDKFGFPFAKNVVRS